MMPFWLLAALLLWIGLSVGGGALLFLPTGQSQDEEEWRYSIND